MSAEYWYMLPISIVVATIAMSSGVGGAVFFSPMFLLWLELEPTVAIGIALITELAGFASGLVAYLRERLVDFRLGTNLLMFSVPGAIIGVWSSDLFPPVVLKAIFAVGLVFIGIQLFTSWRQEQKEKLDRDIEQEPTSSQESELTDKNGKTYHYTVCHKDMGRAFAAVGGAFVGMISVGLAELQDYHLVAKCRVPSAVAVATSIFVVVVTVAFASAGHIYEFASEGSEALDSVIDVATFTVPGVLIGGQLGPRLQARLNPDVMKIAISLLFMGIGAFMLTTLFAG